MMQAEKIAQAMEPADQRDAAYTKIVEEYVAAAKERKSDEALRLALKMLSSAQIGNVSGRDIMYDNVASQQVGMGQIEPAKATLMLMTRHQNVRRMVAQAIAKTLTQKKDTGLVGWIQSLPDTVVRAAAYSGVLQAMLDVEM